jgi:hypothetical protein
MYILSRSSFSGLLRGKEVTVRFTFNYGPDSLDKYGIYKHHRTARVRSAGKQV